MSNTQLSITTKMSAEFEAETKGSRRAGRRSFNPFPCRVIILIYFSPYLGTCGKSNLFDLV